MVSKFKSRPPEKKVAEIEDFISGAEKKPEEGGVAEQQEPEPLPWDAPGVTDEIVKGYNLRLPLPYLLKLRYIAKHTPDSMHRFCLDAVMEAVDKKIEELTKG